MSKLRADITYSHRLNSNITSDFTISDTIGAAQMPKLYGIWAAKICQNYLDKKSHYLWHPKLIMAFQINFSNTIFQNEKIDLDIII